MCDSTPNPVDSDGDGINDDVDNCPNDSNADQADSDGDGTGDVCDDTPNPVDSDGDGINDDVDNCPNDSNADQTDSDGDGTGDVCDDYNGDNRAPEISLFSSSSIKNEYTSGGIRIGGTLTVTQTASDPDGDNITYSWELVSRSVGWNPGVITESNGSKVIVDLWVRRSEFIPLSLVLTVTDEHGNKSTKTLEFF